MALEKLKKHQTIPFVDISDSSSPTYARIGKSTIFDLVLNANVLTNNYIEDEMPTDEVDYYKPTLSQELATMKGDTAFDFFYEMLYDLPTGEALKKKVLLVLAGNVGTEEAPSFNAWLVPATIVLKNLNTVDEKILFDLNFGGNIERGTATVTDGTPTFTKASAAASA